MVRAHAEPRALSRYARCPWDVTLIQQPDESWRRQLSDARFLEPEGLHGAGAWIGVDVPVDLMTVVASPPALERDGYHAERRGDVVRVAFPHEPVTKGLWEVGADFHWGCTHLLADVEAMRAPQASIAGRWDDERLEVFAAYQEALAQMDQGQFASALAMVQDVMLGRPPGATLEWRHNVLRGILRLGFAGGDLSLVDLSDAQECFVRAVRHAEEQEGPGIAAHVLALAAGTAAIRQQWATARAYVRRALDLMPRFGEARFLSARIHFGLGDEDTAFEDLAQALTRDRCYALRAVAAPELSGRLDALRDFLRDMGVTTWQRGAPRIEDELCRVAFWRRWNPAAGVAAVPR